MASVSIFSNRMCEKQKSCSFILVSVKTMSWILIWKTPSSFQVLERYFMHIDFLLWFLYSIQWRNSFLFPIPSILLTFFLHKAIYSAIGLVIYVFCYCIIIRQINSFREDYLHFDNMKDSIDDVSINDFVKRDIDKY